MLTKRLCVNVGITVQVSSVHHLTWHEIRHHRYLAPIAFSFLPFHQALYTGMGKRDYTLCTLHLLQAE